MDSLKNQPTALMSLRAVNGNVIDMVQNNHWVNDLGTKTKINRSENPFGNPNGCIEFAGGKDRLMLNITNPAFDMKNKDWTLSFWIKYSELTNQCISVNQWQCGLAYNGFGNDSSSNPEQFWMNMFIGANVGAHEHYGAGAAPTIFYNPSSRECYLDGINFDGSQWNHIALVQKESVAYFLCNGKLIWTFSHPNVSKIGFSINNHAPICLGGADDDTGSRHVYQGYIDDFTIINNQALWTTDYKVPTNYLIRTKSIYLDSKKTAWAIS